MKKQTIYFLVFFLMASYANTLLAEQYQMEEDVRITSAVDDNLYIAGGDIFIEAPIRGDLIGAGGNIIVEDSIMKDGLIAGGDLKIKGYIGDDLRIGGGTVEILNGVEGDLIIAGGEVLVGKDAYINGEVYVMGGSLTMNGTARGKVSLQGGEIKWNGTAENDLTAKARNLVFNGTVKGNSKLSAKNINIGSNAQFFRDVEYWNATGDLDFGNALLGGAVSSFNEDLKVYESDFNWRYLGVGMIAFWIYRLLVAVVIIALLIWMFHHFFSRIGAKPNRDFARHLGLGFLYVLGVPLLIGLAFITVIGIPIGIFMMFFFGLTLALGHIIASLLIAYSWNYYYEKGWNRRQLFLAAISSYLALKLVGAIPFLGLFISLIVVMVSFGILLLVWWQNRSLTGSGVN